MKNAKGKGAVKNSKETLKPVDDRKVRIRKASYKPEKSSTQKPKKAKKDPNQPKSEEFRKTFTKENPERKGVVTVAKAGGAKWKSLTNAVNSANNASEMEILFKDTVATGNGAWTSSKDPEGVAGQNSNKMYTPMIEKHGVEDLGVQGEEYKGIDDLTVDPSLSSQWPKRKRGGRDNKKGSVEYRMCK